MVRCCRLGQGDHSQSTALLSCRHNRPAEPPRPPSSPSASTPRPRVAAHPVWSIKRSMSHQIKSFNDVNVNPPKSLCSTRHTATNNCRNNGTAERNRHSSKNRLPTKSLLTGRDKNPLRFISEPRPTKSSGSTANIFGNGTVREKDCRRNECDGLLGTVVSARLLSELRLSAGYRCRNCRLRGSDVLSATEARHAVLDARSFVVLPSFAGPFPSLTRQ